MEMLGVEAEERKMPQALQWRKKIDISVVMIGNGNLLRLKGKVVYRLARIVL